MQGEDCHKRLSPLVQRPPGNGPVRFLGFLSMMSSRMIPLAGVGLLVSTVSPLSQAQTTTVSTTLPPVIVSASRFAQNAAELPIGASLITAEQIRESGAANVNEAIRRLGGVVFRQDAYGGQDYTLDLRGFGETASQNTVILIDGVRVSEAELANAHLSGIPVESVERIEILRGSGTVQYGEGATGGVINIITRRGGSQALAGSLYAAVGSDNLRDGRATIALAKDGFSLNAAGFSSHTNNYRDNFKAQQNGGSVNGQWTNGWARLGVRAATDDQNSRLPGGLNETEFHDDPEKTSTPNDWAELTSHSYGVYGDIALGNWTFAADMARRKKTLEAFQFGSVSRYDIRSTQTVLTARHLWTHANWTNSLVLGYDGQRWDRASGSVLGSSTADQDSDGYYIKDDIDFRQTGTRLSLGARTENFDKHVYSFAVDNLKAHINSWEIGVNQSLTATLNGYVKTGRSFRLANADEYSYTNPLAQLRPQISRDWEVGLKWNQAQTRAEIRAYRSDLTDEIGYDPAANGPFSPFFNGANVNYDPTRRQGIELEGSVAPFANLTLTGLLAWRDATFRAGPYAGNQVPMAPRRTATLLANWKPLAGHMLEGGVRWVSAQRIGGDFTNSCDSRIPSYTTLDARYAYQWKNWEFSVAGSNLSDRNYYTLRYSCSAASRSIYPEAGRTIKAAVRVAF